MSDHLDRVEAFLDARVANGEARRGLITVVHGDGNRTGERPGMYRRKLTDADLRALLADAKQLRAQATEYGIDAIRLAQIRDRSQRLAEIPFDHHDDANHIVTDLIDSAADVKWLIKQLDQTRTDTAPQQPENGGDPR